MNKTLIRKIRRSRKTHANRSAYEFTCVCGSTINFPAHVIMADLIGTVKRCHGCLTVWTIGESGQNYIAVEYKAEIFRRYA